MKTYFYFFICLAFFYSCNEESNIPQIKDEAGLLIDISSSEGSLLGIPSETSEENGTVIITETMLNYEINIASGNLDNINKIELIQVFSGSNHYNESVASTIYHLPYSYTIDSLEGFLENTEIEESDLRIGDSFTFKLKVYQNDGDIFYYDNTYDTIVTLTDLSTNDVLNITTSWDDTYTANENGATITLETCTEVDFDIYLYDLDFNHIATIAESSECPEVGSISNLEDGTYMIGVYLYDNFLDTYNLNETLPLTITYSQDRFIEETSFTNNEFNTNDSWDDYKEVIVATVEVKDGYLYTITPL